MFSPPPKLCIYFAHLRTKLDLFLVCAAAFLGQDFLEKEVFNLNGTQKKYILFKTMKIL